MFGRYKRLGIAVVASALLAGGVLTATALAETPTPQPKDQATSQQQNYRQVFLQKLAALLGVDEEKLQSSVKQAATDTIDEAVKSGDLTQKQADRAKEFVDKAGPGFLGKRLGPALRMGRIAPMPRHMAGLQGSDVLQAVADKLGMSVDDLRSELCSGKALTDIAKEKGVSEQEVRDAAVAAAKTQLDQAVKDGKLTQKQADAILERLREAPQPVLRWGRPWPMLGR